MLEVILAFWELSLVVLMYEMDSLGAYQTAGNVVLHAAVGAYLALAFSALLFDIPKHPVKHPGLHLVRATLVCVAAINNDQYVVALFLSVAYAFFLMGHYASMELSKRENNTNSTDMSYGSMTGRLPPQDRVLIEGTTIDIEESREFARRIASLDYGDIERRILARMQEESATKKETEDTPARFAGRSDDLPRRINIRRKDT